MKKMIVLFFSAAVLAFLLNACTTPAAETASHPAGIREDELKTAELFATQMLDGLFGDSYEKFIKDLTPEGRAKVTEPVFNTIRSEVLKRMGTYKSRVYLGCLDRGIFNIYLWKGSFEPSEQVLESLKIQKKSKKDHSKIRCPDPSGNGQGGRKMESLRVLSAIVWNQNMTLSSFQ